MGLRDASGAQQSPKHRLGLQEPFASLMRVRHAGAAAATRAGLAGAGGAIVAAACRGSENGQLLRKPFGTAVRAFGSFPVLGADENLAVLVALFAMEFVNRHAAMIRGTARELKLATVPSTLLSRPG